MTELKYMEDTYLFTYTSTIQKIDEDDRGTFIVLKSTIFYPQGGGQPTDHGVISNATTRFNVTFVTFIDGDVLHYGSYEFGSFEIGDKVDLEVDGVRRIRNAKNHSGGHLIGFIVESTYPGMKATKGYHFDDGPYVEFSGDLSSDDKENFVLSITDKVNQIVKKNKPIEVFEVNLNELSNICKDIPKNIPKGKPVRVMKLNTDAYPCGGTHVKSTGELEKVSIRKVKYKGSTTRVSYNVA